jgi:hypothetical protein
MDPDQVRKTRRPPQTTEAAPSMSDPSTKECIMTEPRDATGHLAWWEDDTSDGAWANAWCPSWEMTEERTPIHASKPAELRLAAPDLTSPVVPAFETFLSSTRSTFFGA